MDNISIISLIEKFFKERTLDALPQYYSNVVANVNPFLITLTIGIIAFKGFKIIVGQEEPKSAMWFMLKTVLIFGFLNSPPYLAGVARALYDLKEGMFALYAPSSQQGTSIFDYVLTFFSEGATKILAAGEKHGWDLSSRLAFYICAGIIIVIGYITATSMWLAHFGFYTAFNILLMLTPVAIIFGMFSVTKDIFSQWFKGILSSMLVSVTLIAIISIYMSAQTHIVEMITSVEFGGKMSLPQCYMVTGTYLLCGILLWTLKNIGVKIGEQLSAVAFESTASGARAAAAKQAGDKINKIGAGAKYGLKKLGLFKGPRDV